jgi:hypothetical protein
MTNPRRNSNPYATLTDEYLETLVEDNPPSYWSRLARDGYFPEGVDGTDPRIREVLEQRFPGAVAPPQLPVVD